MAPLSFIQNPGLRLVLTASIILNLLLSALCLFAIKYFADAMAKAQINIVEKVSNVDQHVSDMKKDAHDQMEHYTLLGQNRQIENNQKFAVIETHVGSLLEEVQGLKGKAEQATTAAKAATKATKATHAKLDQKIITGPEADALKRAARKKTTIIKIFPWD
jgi:hypothetical protein